MTTALLTLAQFKLRTIMPPTDVDAIETYQPGWIAQQLATETANIYSRITKRYAWPFDAASPPEKACQWLTWLVTFNCYFHRGLNPSDQQSEWVKEQVYGDHGAYAEMKEAADSNVGLFELPVTESSPNTSGIVKGGPYAYSEQSPYTWTDVQREAVENGG